MLLKQKNCVLQIPQQYQNSRMWKSFPMPKISIEISKNDQKIVSETASNVSFPFRRVLLLFVKDLIDIFFPFSNFYNI